MTTIVTRTGKGSPLTHVEVDTNFTNLNTAKLEAGAIALGSAAAPSISFTSDTNTGIYSPGADTLAFVTAGTNRLHITSGGLVGLGTSSPGAALDVVGSTFIRGAAGGRKLEIGMNVAAFRIAADTTSTGLELSSDFTGGYIDMAVGGTSRMYISSLGRVGIGTTSPGSALEINAAAATSPFIAKINTAEVARIDSSGRLLVGTSTANANGGILQLSSGITFPATAVASADANTLDDYEEGMWTPSVTNMTTTGSPAYDGRYRKIGSQVTIWFFTTTAGGVATYAATANSTNVAGLPFVSGYEGTLASGGPPGCAVNGATTAGGFVQGPSNSSGSTTFYFSTTIVATQGMSVSLTYYV